MSARAAIQELGQRMQRTIIGQETVIERLILALLAGGNVLLEGLPGLAKTRAVKSLASNLEADFSRIQFTPDLLPSDVTGSDVYVTSGAKSEFVFQAGPIFGNLILADEINRAPAKVQSALLEAMEERQVTVSGKTHALPELFMVLATQNPIEQEGTYPLPEAQRDRFLLHVMVRQPDDAHELAMLRLVRSEEQPTTTIEPPPRIPQQTVFAAREEVHRIGTTEVIDKYIVAIVSGTRKPQAFGADLARWISIGASPRGTLALDRASRARAWLQGRDNVTPDDVRAVALDCLRHRVLLSYEAHADGKTADEILTELLRQVAVG